MRYVITAPPYTQKSAGIKVLYELQKWLIRYGRDAMVLNFDSPYQLADDDIVVYPEIVSGNPLKAKRVVRYILNHPGRLGGDKEYDKDEILVAYDSVLAQYSNGVILRTPCIEDFFTDRGYERAIDCFFVGKEKNTNHPVTKDCIEITYIWPAKRRELAELLNRTRYLYTYDQRTALISEAAQCGCKVKNIIGDQISDNQIEPFDLELFKRQLEQFIQMTWYPEIDLNKEASDAIDIRLSALEIKKHLDRGESLRVEKRYEEALEEFSAAGRIDKALALPHVGECLANLGRTEEAKAAYSKALEYNPTDVRANIGMGVVKLLTKDYGEAAAAFNRALKGEPSNSKALCGLGMAWLGQGRTRVGLTYLTRSLDSDPENIAALNELITAAFDHERFPEAVSYTRAYLKHHPGDLHTLFSFAGLLYKSCAHDEALDALERLLVLSPEYPGWNELHAKIISEKQLEKMTETQELVTGLLL